jgi:hypothetical protein
MVPFSIVEVPGSLELCHKDSSGEKTLGKNDCKKA